MQAAPEKWNDLFAREHSVEVRVLLAGEQYGPESLTACSVERKLFSAFGIGNACSAILRLRVFPKETIPRMASIKVSVRLREGDAVTAWVPQGTFFIDTREIDQSTGVLSLVAYDRMLMAEQDYFQGTISGEWPKAAPAVVADICARLGTVLDARSVIDPAVLISCPVGMTVREVLCGIAAALGGNWVITPADQLRLIPLEDLPDVTYLGDEAGDYVSDEAGSRIMIIEGAHHSIPCETARRLGDTVSAGGVQLNTDDDTCYIAGGNSGITLEAWCPFASQSRAEALLAALSGIRYTPMEVTGAICDPLLELGDAMSGGGVLFRACTVDMDYGAACAADITAPIDGEVDHEYPYQDKAANRADRKLAQAKAEIRMTTESITAEVAAVDGRVSTVEQTADQIKSSVVGLDGRVSTVEQTASGLMTTVSGLDGDVSTLYQKVNNITLEVTNRSASSTIALSVDGIEVSSQRIEFTGDVVFAADLADGTTVVSGDCITTGEISARYIKLGGQMEVYKTLSGTVCGGYLGYMTGQTATGSTTSGIGIANDSESAVMLCTSAGARMGFDGTSSVVCTSNKVTLAADQVVVDGTLRSSDGTVITSDRAAKKNISYGRVGKYLGLFDLLKPAVFRLKGRKRRHLGFIAQDVEEALRASGIPAEDFAGLCVGEEGYGLRYEEFIPLLTAKVQQLEVRIRRLEGRDG